MLINTAALYILGIPYRIDKLYDYFIPSELRSLLSRGSVVTVPFGRSNRKSYAVVSELHYTENTDALKPISTVDLEYTLTEDNIRLCSYMKENTFCSFGDAVRVLLPSAFFSKIKECYSLSGNNRDRSLLSAKALVVYDAFQSAGTLTVDSLVKRFGKEVTDVLPVLVELGYLRRTIAGTEKNIKKEEYIHLVPDNDSAYGILRDRKLVKGIKQTGVIEYLLKHGSTPFSELSELLEISRATLKALTEKKLIEIEERELTRSPYHIKSDRSEVVLSDAQQVCYNDIEELLDTNEPRAALFYGITGSGKTSVIKKAIDHVISAGKRVIMLVPEIALTPQAVSIFCSYYGEKVAVIHSSLSDGERYDAWRKMRRGKIDLCIGTRSAVFAPLDNLGMIVIDEEHEHTYKSDISPKYHARDIARFRCASDRALMLLASATPSVESMSSALSGKYKLITLKERFNNATLPQTIINDMRLDAREGNLSPVGTLMKDAVGKTLAAHEQVILFVNRRGYNNYVSCPLCGYVAKCERCSVSLTFHSYSKGTHGKSGYLVCHYCGARSEIPKICPECSNEQMNYIGFGTQKTEDDVAELFPEAEISRMDADTTGSKYSFDKLLERFRNGSSDILIGTQMVSKGHDFPGVTLVGVLSADNSLYLDDYRANERTFSLITQVVGRAGRADKPGTAIIQTYNPEHPVIKFAAAQDYDAFYKNEIALRKHYVFPPFCDIILMTFASPEETSFKALLSDFADRLNALLSDEYRDVPLITFGPFEAPVYRVNGTYRMRFIFKCKNNKRTRALFSGLYSEFSCRESNKLSISIDINPNSL